MKPTESHNDENLEGRNNNPEYPANIVDRMNTPFDHVDRILLQDFSDLMFNDDARYNYFKSIYDDQDGVFGEYRDASKYHIDSFTYTPFIDYSQTEYDNIENPDVVKTGVYSDQFLTDYNCGKYDASDNSQVDTHRHTLSSNLFTLRNLEKDIYDAKMGFRKSIADETDAKVYIYTFCEHIAKLFAKLSNIRMCHEIYGFKHPHHEWEGILALDIWYQALYKEIDEQYPFDDKLMNMNPMTRKENAADLGDDWTEDPYDSGYVCNWNSRLFDAYNVNANLIASTRKECVTPRGVLGKIYAIVQNFGNDGGIQKNGITENGFSWFYQKGKVYSDPSKSMFTKYVNLHLGRAYEVMSAKDYCELRK